VGQIATARKGFERASSYQSREPLLARRRGLDEALTLAFGKERRDMMTQMLLRFGNTPFFLQWEQQFLFPLSSEFAASICGPEQQRGSSISAR
jgi:hypothetical protein